MTKIATWNVNSIRSRMENLQKWIKESAPDIVLLQETKVTDDQFPKDMIEDLGYNVVFHGQKSYNGVAILSKFSIEDVKFGLDGNDEDLQARYVEAFTGGLKVASIYVPNGQEVGSDKFDYKMRFMDFLYNHTKELLKLEEKFVIGGDFNIAPTDRDVYDPDKRREKILCSTPEREALRKTLNLGLTDALRAIHPENSSSGKSLYTWWDYRSGGWQLNQGFRIDHLLLSPQASDVLKDAGVDGFTRGWSQPSDHAPTWISVVSD